jgi:hypothetical protein
MTEKFPAFRPTVEVKTYMITNGVPAPVVYTVIYMGIKQKSGNRTSATWDNKTVTYLEEPGYRFVTSLHGW